MMQCFDRPSNLESRIVYQFLEFWIETFKFQRNLKKKIKGLYDDFKVETSRVRVSFKWKQ